MTALTFNQALVKYRPDQARDERGRFAGEGHSGARGNDRLVRAYERRFGHRPPATMSSDAMRRWVEQKEFNHAPGDRNDSRTEEAVGRAKAPAAASGKRVGDQLVGLLDRLSRARAAAERLGDYAAAKAHLTAASESVRSEASQIIDTLAKAPVAESHAASKIINARRASSRKAALLSLRHEVLGRIHAAHKGLSAYYTRPW